MGPFRDAKATGGCLHEIDAALSRSCLTDGTNLSSSIHELEKRSFLKKDSA